MSCIDAVAPGWWKNPGNHVYRLKKRVREMERDLAACSEQGERRLALRIMAHIRDLEEEQRMWEMFQQWFDTEDVEPVDPKELQCKSDNEIFRLAADRFLGVLDNRDPFHVNRLQPIANEAWRRAHWQGNDKDLTP